jgi:hypothetical protein
LFLHKFPRLDEIVRATPVYGGISRRERAGGAKLALDFLARDARQ